MKLYTRLIEEGVFIFWSSDEGNAAYNLKIRIAVGDEHVELLNLNIPKGQNYFSFDKIGSGDYEIELNGYRDNRLYQTETKKVKITSSVQRSHEIMEMLKYIEYVYNRAECLIGIESDVEYIKKALSDPKTKEKIRENFEFYERHGWC